MYGSKGPRRTSGKPCRETGGRTGKASAISTARACPSESRPAMAEPSRPLTWHLQIGSLASPFPAAPNFKNTVQILRLMLPRQSTIEKG